VSATARTGLLALFGELDSTVDAIEKLRALRQRQIVAFTPVPRHELDHALREPESPVRIFTLVGGLTGAATGFALGTWTSLDWPLVTGGKPIISLPPFVIIAFELTILFGALSTVLGFLINARLPRPSMEVIYDPSFSQGTFGVYVIPTEGSAGKVREVLRDAGAREIREGEAEVHVAGS
jgi:hypothetical protein